MKIKLEKILNLDDGEYRFHFETAARDIGLGLTDYEGHEVFDRPVVTDVVLNKTSHIYYVKLYAASDARFLCDRCLEDARHTITGEFQVAYTDLKSNREVYDSESEVRLIEIHKANEITLDKDVCDTLMLEIPTKVLCKEDCKGLCVQCGANLNEALCEHAVMQMNANN
ncbi:DUF177 domain-containing protein [bacterium]|nr:DUF177 domain-containing protein [bacterium]